MYFRKPGIQLIQEERKSILFLSVETIGTIIKTFIVEVPYILYIIIKHLCHRDSLADVESYVPNINFATSNFLDLGHEKQRLFLLMNYIHTVPNLFQTLLELSS